MGLLSGGVPNGTLWPVFLFQLSFLLNLLLLLLLLLRQMFSLCHLVVVPMHNALNFLIGRDDENCCKNSFGFSFFLVCGGLR